MSETTKTEARNALVDMLAGKVRQAQANGATEDEAIAAVRSLWIEQLGASR